MKRIPVIVLTGGPCAGKTTILAKLQQKLSDIGYTVITVSEAATDLILSGISPGKLPVADFQSLLLQFMIAKENFWKIAAAKMEIEKVVILCDRGALDGAAYVPQHEFELMIALQGYKISELSSRYDEIMFLHSVAVDRPEIFTLANNKARSETVEQACELDARTLAAWVGHDHVSILDNSMDIEEKAHQAFKKICHRLGEPVPVEIEEKYRVIGADLSKIPRPMQKVEIGQYYLKVGDSVEERIRSRTLAGGTTYYHNIKRKIRSGMRWEEERKISQEEYIEYLSHVNPEFGKIEKTRYCFCYKGQYFELDAFSNPQGLVLLEIELTEEGIRIELPEFLQGKVQNVTHDEEMSNREIARRLAKGMLVY